MKDTMPKPLKYILNYIAFIVIIIFASAISEATLDMRLWKHQLRDEVTGAVIFSGVVLRIVYFIRHELNEIKD